MRARYYDASIGRFISEDPAGFEGGLNLYAYVGGNPIIFIDPSGLGPEAAGSGCVVLCASWPTFPDWTVNAVAGFGSGVSLGMTDIFNDWMGINVVDLNSAAFKVSEFAGVLTTGNAIALRGFAFLGRVGGGTRFGHFINHNRFLRFGPGRMPANGNLPAGPKVPRMSIGRGPDNPHFDLRVRPIDR